MNIVPQKLDGVAHPLVAAIYKKRDFTSENRPQDVLVIETNFTEIEDDDSFTFRSHMMDLLIDLKDIKTRAEHRVGPVDRIDICSC